MDIKRTAATKPLWRKYWYLLPVILLITSAMMFKRTIGDASYVVNKEEIRLAKVEQGVFRVDVRGVGVLKPQDIRWVSAQVAGRVEQVLVKAGAEVSSGQPLLQLSNPQLHRDLEKARWELEATKAESRAAYVAMESQLLDLQTSVTEAGFNYKSTKLRLDAETELLSQNSGSMSKLDYQKTKLALEQQLQRWHAQQQRVNKMQENLAANQLAQQARLGLVENNYQRAREQVKDLTVRATTSGVIQQVSLELGQQAIIGASVALIANQQSLMAQLQIQELQIRDITIGQPVMIDTRSSEIRGEVVRIDPAVNAGMVEVDVKLLGKLPGEARPDLNVEGMIEISNISDALFVSRPAFAPRFTTTGLYLLSSDANFAKKHQVELGQSSVNRIQILSGLSAGDTIVISDTTAWQHHSEILIN